MSARLCGGGARVLNEWERSIGANADAAGQQARDELARGDACQLSEVTVEVRLVGVAAPMCDLRPARSPSRAQQVGRAMKSKQTDHCLRRQTHLLAEPSREVAPAAAELAGQRLDRESAAGLLEPTPRPDGVRRQPPRGADALGDEALQQREPLGPVWSQGEALHQLGRRSLAEQVLERDAATGQLMHR